MSGLNATATHTHTHTAQEMMRISEYVLIWEQIGGRIMCVFYFLSYNWWWRWWWGGDAEGHVCVCVCVSEGFRHV